MTMQIHDVSLEVLRTLTLVRHIGADEAPARKRLRKICDKDHKENMQVWQIVGTVSAPNQLPNLDVT